MEQYKPPVNAPELNGGIWLNSHAPIQITDLRGQVILVDIFDFTCINCVRTLPYLREWHEKYEDLGLKVIGIHTPEFRFAHDPDVVGAGIGRLGIRWPVLLDNAQELWTAYANRYWPSLYLIDGEGKIRYRHVGEGGYQEIEETLQKLLREINPAAPMPELLTPLRKEDAPGAVCAPCSPEIQLGAIYNLVDDSEHPTQYHIPDALQANQIYLAGSWQVIQDGITLMSREGELAFRYQAARVYAVLAPKPAAPINLPSINDPLYIQVMQDGEPLARSSFGQDMQADGDFARFRVDVPRLYDLIEDEVVAPHDLKLKISTAGFTLYAFSFGSCVV
jgi:thiol-disulfide isomerase/thioredoxin